MGAPYAYCAGPGGSKPFLLTAQNSLPWRHRRTLGHLDLLEVQALGARAQYGPCVP
jgi:hypothetical protein